MTQNYDRIEDNRNITAAAENWDSAIAFAPASNTYKLMRALVSELNRVDENLEEIYEQQHIDSATGEELNEFGELVNIPRKTGEDDDAYRARIKASFRASTMGTTYDQFVEFVAAVLSSDISNFDFITNYGSDPATITVSANSSVYNNVNLTAADIEEILGKGVPAGHEVKVLESGTFIVKKDGQADDASKGLTSDGITTGGTLAQDVN